MKPVIFIDGREGTTGLQIYDRLTPRQDIELLLIDEEKRKDPAERKKCLNAADLVFLCLPDEAAREAVAMIDNPNTRVIDASTAHRTAPGWDYGFPELSPHHRARIVCSKRVANPGCHASGFIASVYPLVQLGLIPPDHPLCAYSLTGYSGGGKKLIAEYQDPHRDPRHASARIYGTNLHHKHLPEMVHVCGLAAPPVFHPILGDYIQGMATTVLLRNDTLPGRPTAQEIHQALSSYYAGQTFVSVAPFGGDEPVIYSDTLVGTNQLRLIVCGHEAQTTVTALFGPKYESDAGFCGDRRFRITGREGLTSLCFSTPFSPRRFFCYEHYHRRCHRPQGFSGRGHPLRHQRQLHHAPA